MNSELVKVLQDNVISLVPEEVRRTVVALDWRRSRAAMFGKDGNPVGMCCPIAALFVPMGSLIPLIATVSDINDCLREAGDNRRVTPTKELHEAIGMFVADWDLGRLKATDLPAIFGIQPVV